MAKTSGGVRDGGGDGAVEGGLNNDTNYKGSIKNVESLVHMKDPRMYKATKEAISRYESAMGVSTRNVKLADLGKNVLGIGSKDGVYLNKKYFNQTHKAHTSSMEKMYKSGWQTHTNKPSAHVITHELAHATWQSSRKDPQARAAKKEINALYKKWSKDNTKTGYGKYATSNVDEFWAETVTKAVHGKADKYTKRVKSIAKKYKL